MTFSPDHLRGWHAAGAGHPFGHLETGDWKEGWRLHESMRTSRRRWNQIGGLSAATH